VRRNQRCTPPPTGVGEPGCGGSRKSSSTSNASICCCGGGAPCGMYAYSGGSLRMRKQSWRGGGVVGAGGVGETES
jgi:hypothetical protein